MKKPLHVAVLLALASPAAFAQTPPAAPDKKDEAKTLESITVVGSRRVNASSTDTPVPVDFLPINKINETNPQFDLGQSLQYLSPSFNSTRQTGADGATRPRW
jgi:iron complex outermembrane receptor protein